MESMDSPNPSVDRRPRDYASQITIAVSVGVIVKIVSVLVPDHTGPWPRWIAAILCALAVLYALYAISKALGPGVRRRLRDRRIEAQIRDPLLAVAAQFLEAVSQDSVSGGKCILDTLVDAKAIDILLQHQCINHLVTLSDTAKWLIDDIQDRKLSGSNGLQRLLSTQTNYVHLYRDLSNATSTLNRPALDRAWDDMRDHINSIGRRLADLQQHVRIARGEDVLPIYVETVPRRPD